MPAEIKAIVFKTAQLKETKHFFETILQCQIKETSARHFVIYSKNIRLVFVESEVDFKIEMYVSDKSKQLSQKMQFGLPDVSFKSCKDPNGMTVIIS